MTDEDRIREKREKAKDQDASWYDGIYEVLKNLRALETSNISEVLEEGEVIEREIRRDSIKRAVDDYFWLFCGKGVAYEDVARNVLEVVNDAINAGKAEWEVADGADGGGGGTMVMNNRIMRDKAQEERAQIYHNLHSALVEFYRMFKEDDQTLAHAHLHISRLVAEVTDEILDTWDDDDSENPDSWNDPNG